MVEYSRRRDGKGALENDLMDYFKGDQYNKVDKPESARMRREGYKTTETPAYQYIQSIVEFHHNRATSVMEQGLTAITRDWAERANVLRQSKAAAESRHSSEQSKLVNDLEALRQYSY